MSKEQEIYMTGKNIDIVKAYSSVINETVMMHELNYDLLETLTLAMLWVRSYTENNNIPLPSEERFLSLINKAESLFKQIDSGVPPFLQHLFRTPQDATEP